MAARTSLRPCTRCSCSGSSIDGFRATAAMGGSESIRFRWNVDGHEWEVHIYPSRYNPRFGGDHRVTLDLAFLGSNAQKKGLMASLSCRLVDPGRNLQPSVERSVSNVFCYYLDCSDKKDTITIPDKKEVPLPLPSSNMHQHFGELLQSQTGADVTFTVSGESFAAHKLVLAARSPVFMAEFFGHMNERSSQCVQIEDMEADVFKAMLHFIYTDTAPELEGPLEVVATMAQHLLAAADRYGLDRLKLICEGKLSGGIDVETAATILALAEQHNCSLLKAKCLEFITGSPQKLDAVLATEGYKHLVASCPLMLTELVKAARGMKN
ncbi:hypothetical protein ACP70R_044038 [Stipagrostis hirtigluma subsp. patula]